MWRVVLEGMAVGVALAAPIGPINVEIVRRGLFGGFRHGWLVGFGAVTVDTLYCLLVVTGLAPVADSALLRAPLFLAGAVVMLYLGVASVLAARRDSVSNGGPSSPRRSYITGMVMAAANPLGIIYWLSIGAALVASAVTRAGEHAAPFLIGGVFTGIICWVTLLSSMTRLGRRFVSPSVMRWVTGLSGVALILFGCYFAVQGAGALMAR